MRASGAKSEKLATQEEMKNILDIPVAKVVKGLGVRMDRLEQDQAWEEVLHRVKLKSTRSGRMPLHLKGKILTVYQRIYPPIFNVLEIYE